MAELVNLQVVQEAMAEVVLPTARKSPWASKGRLSRKERRKKERETQGHKKKWLNTLPIQDTQVKGTT